MSTRQTSIVDKRNEINAFSDIKTIASDFDWLTRICFEFLSAEWLTGMECSGASADQVAEKHYSRLETQ